MKTGLMRSPARRPRTAAFFGSLALIALVWSAPSAHAQKMCSGTISSTLMQALPPQTVISLQTSSQDSANPALVNQFLAGLQGAGVQIAPQGTAVLGFSVEVSPSNSGSTATAGTYSDFSWAGGQVLPPGQPGIRGAALSVGVQLTDTASAALLWLVTINCTIETNDSAALAQELGTIIGRSLGKSFQQRPL